MREEKKKPWRNMGSKMRKRKKHLRRRKMTLGREERKRKRRMR